MLAGWVALILAAAFAALAMYISVIRHSASEILSGKQAVLAWRRSFWRDRLLLAALALGGGSAALWHYHWDPGWGWFLAGFMLLANLPYGLLVMGPTNRLLLTKGMETTARASPLLSRWYQQHRIRTILGALALVGIVIGKLGLDYGRL